MATLPSNTCGLRVHPGESRLSIKNLPLPNFGHTQTKSSNWKRKRAKYAEVLMPERVEARFILEASVFSQSLVAGLEDRLDVAINRHMFFG